MKKINFGILLCAAVYLFFSILILWEFQGTTPAEDMAYKVEVNELMTELEQGMEVSRLDLSQKKYIIQVQFLAADQMLCGKEQNHNTGQTAEQAAGAEVFFRSQNGCHSIIKPLFISDDLKGYVRFDYILHTGVMKYGIYMEAILSAAFAAVVFTLFYVKRRILQPFWKLSEMPYELSKGHLKEELPESRERYFGKFVWGISMLRDTLDSSKKKELKLEKEKKLLLLSISHDIKIPLSAIKLYARSIYEGMAADESVCKNTAHKIEAHADEIEEFVKKIMEASSEEILSIEVHNSEFYLEDLIEHIANTYTEKCRLRLTDFEIAPFENRLLKGDFDRAIEVMENLMENALKYGDGKKIDISFYEEEDCRIIVVGSTGNPVDDREMPHLFDSFFRGSNVREKEGNGLGLYICRQIMRKMEGEIFAERTEGGMRFHIVFR